jgi:hypothetical protein
MKTSSTWNFRSIVGKIMIGLVLAAMVGTIDVAPALGKDDYKHDKGRYWHREPGDRYEHGSRPYGYHYGNRERVYYPSPPVVYAPPPPPGISILLPPFFIHF